ncbi:hypothetical protein N018_08095 [Pseudomonas syringae CC1557]|uniref:Uncharacterized protein n=1 Tax=Pseudomonas syringae CC1557 TaxID=1357279 RepID=W0MP41_PSESX|nr:hypothetical protein [Pseudomonas syringae]AHG40207.1 hypothetical protein N018_08095 [Pseudomonas syringae CC1557]
MPVDLILLLVTKQSACHVVKPNDCKGHRRRGSGNARKAARHFRCGGAKRQGGCRFFASTGVVAWVVAEGSAEYSATGKLTDFYTSALDPYKGLPAIEQSQYPSSYEPRLQGWIDQDFNYKTHTAEGDADAKSLLDKILDPDSAVFTGQGTAGTES